MVRRVENIYFAPVKIYINLIYRYTYFIYLTIAIIYIKDDSAALSSLLKCLFGNEVIMNQRRTGTRRSNKICLKKTD